MKIADLKLYPATELVSRLKDVVMLKDRTAKPYKAASIQVTDIAVADLSPPQRYILQSELEKVIALRWAFLEHGIDILRLAHTRIERGSNNGVGVDKIVQSEGMQLGFVEFAVEGTDDIVTILPPIVEVSKELDGSTHLLINDGLHRCYMAREHHVTPAVVRVDGVSENYPYYAFPLADKWQGVTLIDEIGEDYIKKFHRFPHPKYKEYYRDFNSAFSNVGGPRGRG